MKGKDVVVDRIYAWRRSPKGRYASKVRILGRPVDGTVRVLHLDDEGAPLGYSWGHLQWVPMRQIICPWEEHLIALAQASEDRYYQQISWALRDHWRKVDHAEQMAETKRQREADLKARTIAWAEWTVEMLALGVPEDHPVIEAFSPGGFRASLTKAEMLDLVTQVRDATYSLCPSSP